jgi:hypothetical protein
MRVAINHFDIDAGICHHARNFSQLSRLILLEPLHQNLAIIEHGDPLCFERFAGGNGVFKMFSSVKSLQKTKNFLSPAVLQRYRFAKKSFQNITKATDNPMSVEG